MNKSAKNIERKNVQMKFETEKEAIEFLESKGYVIERGLIKKMENSFFPDNEDTAITYLCTEWDYDFLCD